MFFASDNWAGAAPEIADAVVREAAKYGNAYGDSDIDKAVAARFNEIFEREVAVFFVATGSAANGLALASVGRPAGIVFCHRGSHVFEDECGGMEFLADGARPLTLGGRLGKLDAASFEAGLSRFASGQVHTGQPMAVSITQMTEAGTTYAIDEIRTIAAIARKQSLPVHMDGARFANALARLGVSPAEMSWKAGIDILSFGATKNGCIGAEALVFFDPDRAKEMRFLRQRSGHLFSKSRFIAAQFDAYFRDGLWMRLAKHANAMGDRLRSGLVDSGHARLAWPTHGNEVFAVLREADAKRLRERGAVFYDWAQTDGDAGVEQGETLVRLVASFATKTDDVDRFVSEFGAWKTKAPRTKPGRGIVGS